jgi:hypothetical protein
MLPFVIGGGVLVGAVALFKKKCSVCDSYLTLNEPCFICGGEVCGDCGKNLDDLGRCCKRKHGKIDSALSNESNVKVYSKNYKGKIAAPRHSRSVETAYYRKKEDAERALRFITAINGGEVVQGVEFVRGTGEDGNYKFAIFKGTGVI